MNPQNNQAHLARIIFWLLAALILGILALAAEAEGQTKPAEPASTIAAGLGPAAAGPGSAAQEAQP